MAFASTPGAMIAIRISGIMMFLNLGKKNVVKLVASPARIILVLALFQLLAALALLLAMRILFVILSVLVMLAQATIIVVLTTALLILMILRIVFV